MKKILMSVLTCFSLPLLADVSPTSDDTFSVEGAKGWIECANLNAADFYCQKTVKTFDPQTGLPKQDRKIKITYREGGEGVGQALVLDSTTRKSDTFYQIRTDDGAKVWVKAKSESLNPFEKILDTESKSYILNPNLTTVYQFKDLSQSLPIKDVYKLENNPNPRIGILEISVDMKDNRASESKKVVTLFYPSRGEQSISIQHLFKAIKPIENLAPQDEKKDFLKLQLPVYKKNGDRYLIELPNGFDGPFEESSTPGYKGIISASVLDTGFKYTWIESKTVEFKFSPNIKEILSFEDNAASPGLVYLTEKSSFFKKNDQPWIGIKIYASFLNFDDPNPEDENGNKGFLSRKKVLLREIFLPLFDERKRINLLPGWEPGC